MEPNPRQGEWQAVTATQEQGPFAGWVILELLGHRRLAGWMQEIQLAGAGFLRIDVPADDGTAMTQMYPPGSVYAITPTTEEIARHVAKGCQPEPVHPWTLRALTDGQDDDREEYDGDDEHGPF